MRENCSVLEAHGRAALQIAPAATARVLRALPQSFIDALQRTRFTDTLRQAAARSLAGQYGATAGSDAGAVLADPRVDAVVVASPTPTHVDLLTRAVHAGKAVLCEKPIDLDLAKVDACWQQIGGSSPVVMVGFNRRFDPSFRGMRERVHAGELGRLEQLCIVSRDPAAWLASVTPAGSSRRAG